MSRRRSALAFAPLPMRALRDERLTTTHFRALGAIAYRDGLGVNRQGCWASPQDLADMCGVNAKNLNTAITDLTNWGYVSRERRPDDKRKRIYRVLYTEEDRTAAKLKPRQAGEISRPQATEIAEIGCPNGRDRLPPSGTFFNDFNAPTWEDNREEITRSALERHSAEAGIVSGEPTSVLFSSGHAGRLLGKVERDASARGYMTGSERALCEGVFDASDDAHTGAPVGGMAYRLLQTDDEEFAERRRRKPH